MLYTYSNDEDIKQIPQVGEILDYTKSNKFDEKFNSEYNGKEIVAIIKELCQVFLFFQVNIFKHLWQREGSVLIKLKIAEIS